MRLGAAQALEFIVGGRGKRYDPAVVEAFVRLQGPASTRDEPLAL